MELIILVWKKFIGFKEQIMLCDVWKISGEKQLVIYEIMLCNKFGLYMFGDVLVRLYLVLKDENKGIFINNVSFLVRVQVYIEECFCVRNIG